MRVMMANMIPWAQFRRTYGAAIVSRELVQRRIGRLAALIVGCDALVDWCSWLLDQGFRGEMECIIAKIFGSEAQKEAAIELFMKTHGGRAFLHGHLFGENVHEYLAPCIYEGEGEMLGMAFFKSLIKEHGKTYFEPIGKALAGLGHPQAQPDEPGARLGAALGPGAVRASGGSGEMVTPQSRPEFPGVPPRLADAREVRRRGLQRSRLEISDVMTKHQLRLADRQCRMAELSQRRAGPGRDPGDQPLGRAGSRAQLVQDAADILCQDLRRKLTGKRPTDAYYRAVTKLGEKIAEGGFEAIAGIEAEPKS